MCTLADMDYDVYHGTINANPDGSAMQEFYAKPRWGRPWDPRAANKLAAMLEASIQRRFPKGLKLHVHSVDRFGSLATLTGVLRDAGLTINRAKVPLMSAAQNCCNLTPGFGHAGMQFWVGHLSALMLMFKFKRASVMAWYLV